MNRQFAINPTTDARVFADNAEQIAHAVRRTVAAVEGIVDDLKDFYKVVSPLVESLKSALAGPRLELRVQQRVPQCGTNPADPSGGSKAQTAGVA
jgi:hypothetical protein